MKRGILCLLILALMLTGCAPAAEAEIKTRSFTDSTGRTLEIPERIDGIAVSGPLSQMYVLPLAGDLLVGVSNTYTQADRAYLPEYLFELTHIGQLYGGKGEMELEALLAAGPDLVIDVGEGKDSIAGDLDALSAQTGIPFVHIDATVATAPEAYRTLGKLLGREEKAEQLAVWCEQVYKDMEAMMARVDGDNARKQVLYCLGDRGLHVIARDSFHAETINMMAENLAVLENTVSGGLGNEVDMEQLLVWDPQVLLFAPDSCYGEVSGDNRWQSLTAVARGEYYKTPAGPYGWLSSPPSVQRYLGMLWLGELLYPEYMPYDLQEKVTEYYRLFYGCELTDQAYEALVANALPTG